MRDGVLQAVVSGRTSGRDAPDLSAWIARDIAEQANREALRRVLIDLRGLADRLGSLGELSLASAAPAAVAGYRVAVVDALENERYYALHELAARARGFVLKCFSSAADAAQWLSRVPMRD